MAMTAFMNVVAIFVFDLHVATTVGKGTVDPAIVDHYVIFGALVGAIGWNIITWYYGIPSSSSHALIGGLIGAAIAKAGSGSLMASGILKIIAFIVISPLLGFILGSLMMLLVSWIFVRSQPRSIDRWFRRLQLVSASLYSLGHGGNDAQKTMGLIWMLLIASGYAMDDGHLPVWAHCLLLRGNWCGNPVRRMAYRQNDGTENHQTETGWRFLCGNGRRADFVCRNCVRYSCFDNPYHYRRYCRGGVLTENVGSQMGRCSNIVWAWILTIPASAFLAAIAWWLGTQFL